MEVDNDKVLSSSGNEEALPLTTEETEEKFERNTSVVSGPEQLKDTAENTLTFIDTKEEDTSNPEPVSCELQLDSCGNYQGEPQEKENVTSDSLKFHNEEEEEENVTKKTSVTNDANDHYEKLEQNVSEIKNTNAQDDLSSSSVADVEATDQDVSLDPVSADEFELSQQGALQNSESNACNEVHEGQVATESNKYTDIHSPESSSLPPASSDDPILQTTSGNVYTDIQSPEGNSSPIRPSDNPAGHNYTDIQSPEAKSSPTGPSDDREDISDGELDLASENIELSAEKETKVDYVSNQEERDSGILDVKRGESKGSVKDETDVKMDDTVKSDAGSIADDASRVSKVPSEDLEAVSEDELPEASHTKITIASSKAVVEGGEDVSSEDEEVGDTVSNEFSIVSTGKIREENLGINSKTVANETSMPPSEPEPVSPTALPEHDSPSGLAEPVSPTDLPEPVSPTALAEPVSPAALPELTPLDAEPISDEEDNSGLAEEEDGEAGEIKSPTEDITSPPSSPEQGGANLGEVEPVSADDSNDTDGELPSGDDEDVGKPGEDQSKNGANFESIESEEDGDMDGSAASKDLPGAVKSTPGGKQDGYMESISDEETIDSGTEKIVCLASQDKSVTAISNKSIESKSPFLQAVKDSESGKKVSAPNFNEHQVELDYEETEADDGEVKPEDSRIEQLIKEKTEEGKHQEVISYAFAFPMSCKPYICYSLYFLFTLYCIFSKKFPFMPCPPFSFKAFQ